MRSWAVGLALAIMGSGGAVLADEPPSWSEFDVRSPNAHYLAQVKATEKPAGAPPWTWTYRLTVLDVRRGARQPLWSCGYAYDGYPDGVLSDDGSTFVYVNFWYEPDEPVVSIYRQGKQSGVVHGREFNVRPAPTVSHEIWLDESESPAVRFVQTGTRPLAVAITTLDHKTHVIDVESGKFVKP